MQPAFCEALPLHHVGFCRPVTLTFRRPTCCTSRPPQKATRTNARTSKEKRSRPRASQPRKRPKELTAAELSFLISQTLGLDIIKSDLGRISAFLRSFVKVKTINTYASPSSSQPNDLNNSPNPDEIESQQHNNLSTSEETAKGADSQLLIKQPSGEFYPRSKIGRAMASKYTQVRGTFDRTLEGVSLATQAVFLNVLARAGTAIYYVLEASEKAFPALNIAPAKRVAEQMVNTAWSPLKSFQWQTAAFSDLQMLRDNRRSRITYVEQYLKGKSGGTYTQALSLLSRSVNSTFGAFETTTPVLFRSASKAASVGFRALRAASRGTVDRKKGSSPQIQKGLSISAPWSAASVRDRLASSDKKMSSKEVSRVGTRNTLSDQVDTKIALPNTPILPKQNRSAILDKGDTLKGTGKEPTVNVIGQTENRMLEKGGAILGAGVLMMAVSGLSLPTAVTWSAVFITTMGVTQAKAAAIEGEIYQQAREAFRQSKSVRKLETIIKPRKQVATQKRGGERKRSLRASFGEQYEVVSISKSSAQRTRKGETTPKPVGVEPEDMAALDVEAFSVSRSEPSILSTPILGRVLNNTDEAAYALEKISGRLSYRLRMALGGRQTRGSWILLRSFSEHASDIS